MGKVVGYARVTFGLTETYRQLDELHEAGCTTIFTDYVSGPADARPELEKALALLLPGDTLVVSRLDKPGRSLRHILSLVATLSERNAGLRILSENIDSRDPSGALLFPLFASLSGLERDVIREKTQIGRTSSREPAKAGGRPPLLSREQSEQARFLYEQSDLTVAEIGARLGVSRTTVYRALGTERADTSAPRRARAEDCSGSSNRWRFADG